MSTTSVDLRKLTQAVLRVGDGRGFAVNLEGDEAAVITAAHCLPRLPSAHPAAFAEERTYGALLGPLGATPTVCAECLFADPIADIAVLGAPDAQKLYDQAEEYDSLLMRTQPLLLTNAPALEQKCAARVLSLDGEWVDCSVTRFARSLSVEPGKLVVSGMSGSPIISLDGRAFGLLSTGRLNPILIGDLPLRLLRGTLASMR